MHLVVDANNRRITAVADGGDPAFTGIDWAVAPVGYLDVVEAPSGPLVGEMHPLQDGIVTVTATPINAQGNVINPPAPVNQNIQVAGSDPETMTVASTNNPVTVPAQPSAHGAASNRPAPGAVAGANAGAGAPAPVVNGHDGEGVVTFGTGAAPAAGAQVVVTFNQPYAAAPAVELTAANDATEALGLEVANVTAQGFTIVTHAAPAAAQAAGTFAVEYTATQA